ncbi:MAG: UDP-2,3-diacylglucosamine diphosphatase LpxI [Alphaproteobacteria bacterium]|nr:UDP-2,3-diacylglucosamine diphosphatase LpxI [Alphaproteobacteria bacterium]NNF24827.1 UDP-2,3-diacylglucosamine diphosphatase LpxI [Paracoccaceae bacterium]
MLVLVAGQGALPGYLAQVLESAGTPFQLAALEGFEMDGAAAHPARSFRIETLGSFLADMVALGATEVCSAGSIQRPPLDPTRVDAATMPLVPRMMKALAEGDDAALRIVLGFFEEAGLRIRGAHEIAPDLLPQAGVLSNAQPQVQDEQDAARGADIVAAMGAADIGQSCVVRKRQALAVEAMPGTDWMLASIADLGPGGGILYKAPKPGQDRRIDLPLIGPDTVEGAARARLAGIVIEAGGVMVLDKPATIAAADKAGLFVWVRAR